MHFKLLPLALLSTTMIVTPVFAEDRNDIKEEVRDIIEASENDTGGSWNISSNIYMELEKFEGHRDADGNAIIDKLTPVAQLFISNPDSNWSYFLEHKVSRRSITDDLKNTDNSFQRNRTQIGATRKIINNDDAKFNLNATYRKESNDAAPGKDARGSHNLYWIMPSGEIKLTDKLSFSYWDAFYYYDRFVGNNDYEWEAEHGLIYRHNDNFMARVYLYNDWTWDNDRNKNWEQNQIRGYFPTKVNDDWSIMPYFRYFLNEKIYDAQDYSVTNKVDDGLRLGLNIDYHLTARSTLWAGVAYEKTNWDEAKDAGLTSGADNTQKFYLGQVGWKYRW
jgi:outer membrane protein G